MSVPARTKVPPVKLLLPLREVESFLIRLTELVTSAAMVPVVLPTVSVMLPPPEMLPTLQKER